MKDISEEQREAIRTKGFEMCSCGHLGGSSPNGKHTSRFEKGHVSCTACTCKQFTWVFYCDKDGERVGNPLDGIPNIEEEK